MSFRPGDGEVLVLDGGLATALEADGFDLNHPLWSGKVLLEAPHAVVRAHRRFLEAGADCIISASYQVSFEGFRRLGIPDDHAKRALEASVTLAREARTRFLSGPAPANGRRRPLVAASVGPYAAFLADGSEYHGRYDVRDHHLLVFHERRLRVLAEAGPDLLAVETIPNGREAHVLGDLLDALEGAPPAWVSFACRDGSRLADGTPVEEAAAGFRDRPGVLAVGVNCTPPRHFPGLIPRIAAASGKPVVAYPNGDGIWDPVRKIWREPAEASPPEAWGVVDWIRDGARLVGGCCRVGPDGIRTIRGLLEAQKRGG